jgi:PhzF family phenazine biosynthesis protein
MKLSLYWIDAFSRRVFSGNPAAVIPLDAWLADDAMQRIAFENGLAETAFFVRIAEARFHLRWFTPLTEVTLCGHATLATAFALFSELGQPGERITFDSKSGPLEVRRREDDLLELDFPARPAAPAPRDEISGAICAGLKTAPRELLVAKGCAYYLAIYDDDDAVRALAPDFAALARLGDVRTIVTAPGTDCDFVSRFFAPGAGVPEDPVTGSAHCTLVPHWAARLGKSRFHAKQLSARGGELWCELRDVRVRMAGHCVRYMRGEISL